MAGVLLAGRKGAEGPLNAQEEEVPRGRGPDTSPSLRDFKRILGDTGPGEISLPQLFILIDMATHDRQGALLRRGSWILSEAAPDFQKRGRPLIIDPQAGALPLWEESALRHSPIWSCGSSPGYHPLGGRGGATCSRSPCPASLPPRRRGRDPQSRIIIRLSPLSSIKKSPHQGSPPS